MARVTCMQHWDGGDTGDFWRISVAWGHFFILIANFIIIFFSTKNVISLRRNFVNIPPCSAMTRPTLHNSYYSSHGAWPDPRARPGQKTPREHQTGLASLSTQAGFADLFSTHPAPGPGPESHWMPTKKTARLRDGRPGRHQTCNYHLNICTGLWSLGS